MKKIKKKDYEKSNNFAEGRKKKWTLKDREGRPHKLTAHVWINM